MTVQPFHKLTYDFLASFYRSFQKNLPVFYTAFYQEFRQLCTAIKQQCDFPIAALDFTMLRTNIAQHKYVAEVIAYGEEHFFDRNSITVGEVDISFIFKEYDLLLEAVLKKSRQYPKELSTYDVQAHMMSVCGDFYLAFTFVLRLYIYELSQLPEFKILPFAEEFEINCGEYMAYTETVYVRNVRKVPDEEIKRLHSGENCNFADFTQLKLGKETFESTVIRFSDFSFGYLDDCNFMYCNLDFSRFREVTAQNAVFNHCVLSGTDFSGADLRNAKFISIFNIIYDEEDKPMLPMEYVLSFRQADLRGAIFENCDLSYVDFAEADIRNTIFDDYSFRTAKLSSAQSDRMIYS